MSEFKTHSPETSVDSLVSKVRESENTKEEAWEERFLAENLFHDKFLDATLHGTEDRIKLLNLEHEFLQEKRGKNMGERFEFAISDKYLGKIHIVELGRTTNPGANGEVDGLKSQYHDFLKWLKEQGVVEEELGRLESPEEVNERLEKSPGSNPQPESRRHISARAPVHPEATNKFMIVVRNRHLIDTSLNHKGRELDVAVTKRMVFGMPPQALAVISAMHDGNLNNEQAQQHIEGLLEHAPDAITPIRTAYYLATYIK